MRDMERDLRDMMQRTADGVDHAPRPDRGLVRRARLRRARTAVVTGAAAVALVVGSFAGARSLSRDDAAPLPPAEEKNREIEPMPNGRIITSADTRQEWHAVDPDAGLFYYFKYWTERAFVLDQDGPVAKFDCPPSADCEFATAFGPGPDELTVPAYLPQSWDLRSVQVIGFDGKVRHTLEMPDVIQNQRITDLAWSPDGSRLAISIEPDCDSSSDSCEGKVWIAERDGGEPQLVFTERAPADLAWSPDGLSLTVLVSSDVVKFDDEAHNGVWPRLVALRLQPDQSVRVETLHVYDDVGLPAWNDVPDGWRFYFASAWSPDGTRIAVTSKGGIAEISAEDGQVLAEHPRKDPRSLLAWLPKR